MSKASRLAGAGRALRGQPPRHGGSEGSSRAARLHQRIYRTSQGLRIGAAGDRARRLARIQGGTGTRKDELKIHSILLEAVSFRAVVQALGLCPLWVISGHVRCKTACPLYPRKRRLARYCWNPGIGNGWDRCAARRSSSTITPTPSENFSSASSPSRCTCKKDSRDTGVKYTLPFRLMGSRRQKTCVPSSLVPKSK